jgi:hypothetical protein
MNDEQEITPLQEETFTQFLEIVPTREVTFPGEQEITPLQEGMFPQFLEIVPPREEAFPVKR